MAGQQQLNQCGEFPESRTEEACFDRMVQGSKKVFAFFHDANHRFTYLSESVHEVLGYSPAELIGLRFEELHVDSELRARSLDITERAMSGFVQQDPYTVLLRHKSGATVYMDILKGPSRAEDGTIQFQGFASDVTERKLSEQTLQLSNQILNAMSAVILVANGSGQVVYVSPFTTRLLGYPASELLGYGWWKKIRDTADEQRAQCELIGARARGDVRVTNDLLEDCVVDASGHSHWLLWQDTKGPDDLLIGVGQVITEHKRMNEALHQKELQAQAIFDCGASPMFIIDDDARYLDANPAACALLKLRKNQIVGRMVGDFSPTPEVNLAAFRRVITEGTAFGETTIADSAGQAHSIFFTGTANILPGKHLSVLRDLTEHKRLEEQLLQSQKMEAVGRLAGGVAHDFNNMLTAIRGYSELLQKKLSPQHPLRRYADGIQNAADRASMTTQQLLAFSRRQVVQPQPLDLNSSALEISRLLRRLIGEDVELRMSLSPDLGKIKADPGQIGQVLLNLAVNARDAMPTGGTLSIETANVELDQGYACRQLKMSPGRYVLLSMSDSGCGMDKETQSHIFEPFFTTKAAGKGTGLGLPTVYGVVDQAGGSIHVYSEPGQGSTFRLYFPRLDAPSAATHASGKSASTAATVLILEDEQELADMVASVLAEHGYRILAASSGAEAVQLSEAEPGEIDLLVSDVTMPGMDGSDIAGVFAIRQPRMKVLYMSGFPEADLRQRALLPAEAPFLQKPFPATKLVECVESLLEKSVPSETLS